MGIGNWELGIGNWVLGIGENEKSGDGNAVSLQDYLGVGIWQCRVPTRLVGSRDTALPCPNGYQVHQRSELPVP